MKSKYPLGAGVHNDPVALPKGYFASFPHVSQGKLEMPLDVTALTEDCVKQCFFFFGFNPLEVKLF